MYLHIGNKKNIRISNIIGIFDTDNATVSSTTRKYLSRAQKEGNVISATDDIPKSFVVCDHPYHPQIVYLSQFNTATLQKRGESDQPEF